MNEDVEKMAIYGGIGAAGLVGGHMAYSAVRDKMADRRQAREAEQMLLKHEQAKQDRLRASAIDKGFDPDSRVGKAYMQKNFLARALTRGR